MSDSLSYLGKGWSFPPSFSKASGSVDMLSDVADIESSLHILLSTRPGERVMQPDYGCNLDRLMFEPLTTTLKTYMYDLVKMAILHHEPRIKPDGITFTGSNDNEGLVLITVSYTVVTTNTRFNYVYPFYKNEGTDVKK